VRQREIAVTCIRRRAAPANGIVLLERREILA
jgi:hypothetical protein